MYSPDLIFYLSVVYRSVYCNKALKMESLVRFLERLNENYLLTKKKAILVKIEILPLKLKMKFEK